MWKWCRRESNTSLERQEIENIQKGSWMSLYALECVSSKIYAVPNKDPTGEALRASCVTSIDNYVGGARNLCSKV